MNEEDRGWAEEALFVAYSLGIQRKVRDEPFEVFNKWRTALLKEKGLIIKLKEAKKND